MREKWLIVFHGDRFTWTHTKMTGDTNLTTVSNQKFTSFDEALADARFYGYSEGPGHLIEFMRRAPRPDNHQPS